MYIEKWKCIKSIKSYENKFIIGKIYNVQVKLDESGGDCLIKDENGDIHNFEIGLLITYFKEVS